MTKKVQPIEIDHENETVEWTYFISRDSFDGILSRTCSLWGGKPTRHKSGRSVLWGNKTEPIYMGEYHPEQLVARFRTIPETDLELIKVETRPTRKEWADEKAKQRANA